MNLILNLHMWDTTALAPHITLSPPDPIIGRDHMTVEENTLNVKGFSSSSPEEGTRRHATEK